MTDKIPGRAMYISQEGTTWHSSCFGDWHHVMALIDASCCCKMCCFRRDRQILARLLRLSNLQTEHHSPPQRGRVAQWTLCRLALDGIGVRATALIAQPQKRRSWAAPIPRFSDDTALAIPHPGVLQLLN